MSNYSVHVGVDAGTAQSFLVYDMDSPLQEEAIYSAIDVNISCKHCD